MVEVLKDSEGVDYVSVRELRDYLQRLEDAIVAECTGAPDGCHETRAYLYGEICCIRVLRKSVSQWESQPTAAMSQAVQDHEAVV